MEKIGETIEQWEREARDYEKMCKKALDQEIKIGVLACLAPKKVSEHLFLFADNLQTYADARKVVFEFLDAHKAQHAAGAAVPMDVDALTQKGGKGKDGKGGKGRKHGSPDNNSGKANKVPRTSWVCGKTGHKSSECWYKDKKGKNGGKGKKGGKAKGKGKTKGSLFRRKEHFFCQLSPLTSFREVISKFGGGCRKRWIGRCTASKQQCRRWNGVWRASTHNEKHATEATRRSRTRPVMESENRASAGVPFQTGA
eukprot:2724944-Amphidinium_carterae.1